MSKFVKTADHALCDRARLIVRELKWALDDVEHVLESGSPRAGITSPEGMTDEDLLALVDRLELTIGAWLEPRGENQVTAQQKKLRILFLSACETAANSWSDADPQEPLRVFTRAWREGHEHIVGARYSLPPFNAIESGISACRRTKGTKDGKNKLSLLRDACSEADLGDVEVDTIAKDIKSVKRALKRE